MIKWQCWGGRGRPSLFLFPDFSVALFPRRSAQMETELIRNIGIFAHVDSGKTTLSEQLLAKLGSEKRGIIHVVEDPYPRFAYEK